MTAYVQVVTTWPDGTTTTDAHRSIFRRPVRSLIEHYRHVYPDAEWDGDTLTRRRTIHADDSRHVIETITFHDTDPRQEQP